MTATKRTKTFTNIQWTIDDGQNRWFLLKYSEKHSTQHLFVFNGELWYLYDLSKLKLVLYSQETK